MTRTNVPVVEITRVGIDPLATETDGNATDGHSIVNDGQTYIQARNSGTTTRLVTLKIAQTVDGQAVTSKTISITTGATRIFGPFPPSQYNLLAERPGTLEFDVAHAELKLKAFKLVANLR